MLDYLFLVEGCQWGFLTVIVQQMGIGVGRPWRYIVVIAVWVAVVFETYF